MLLKTKNFSEKPYANLLDNQKGKAEALFFRKILNRWNFPKRLQLFNIDFSSKKILAKINQEICENFSENEKFYKVRILLNEIGYDVISDSDFDLQFSEIEFFENIVKIFDFRINSDEMEFIDKVIEYMKFQRSVFGK